MPLPTDETTLKTSQDLVTQLHTAFGSHPGFRATHARGLLLDGTFSPSAAAASLSSAQHFNQPSTPLTIRFSNSTGLPQIPDTDPNANPRGIAIRFNLAEHVHTDIIAHSTPFFPTRTGAEFLQLLQSLGAPPPKEGEPSAAEKFFGSHPAALAFAQAPKPAPSSFAREAYYGVNAFKLVNAEGKDTYFRYRVIPTAGVENLDEAALKGKSDSFLYEELPTRLKSGPVLFKIMAQIAEEGDIIDDATVHWPDSRKLVELGEVRVESVIEENAKEQKKIIFDPIPRIKGVEPSDDPLLEVRAAVYLISGKERRAA
ncbi:catalase, partial [Lecanoromycetidae sp. Uapishka_2]